MSKSIMAGTIGNKFLAVLVAITAVGAIFYYINSTRFAQSCERICESHARLCDKLPDIIASAAKDSVPIDVDAVVAAVNSGNGQITRMLELQHAEIQEDFSNLMLWASVLMVIFLVFSIYSMYKIDDIVSQSRTASERVASMTTDAEKKIENIDKLFKAESDKLAQQSREEIKSLQTASQQRLEDLDSQVTAKIEAAETRIARDIEEYKNTVEAKADNITKSYADVINFFEAFKKFLNDNDSGTGNPGNDSPRE